MDSVTIIIVLAQNNYLPIRVPRQSAQAAAKTILDAVGAASKNPNAMVILNDPDGGLCAAFRRDAFLGLYIRQQDDLDERFIEAMERMADQEDEGDEWKRNLG